MKGLTPATIALLVVWAFMPLVWIDPIQASNTFNDTTTITATITNNNGANDTGTAFSMTTDSTNGDINSQAISVEQEELVVACSLCSDPSHVPLEPLARFEAGEVVMTCAHAHAQAFEIPTSNCSLLQEWGATMCNCGLASSGSNTATCRLCEDGSLLPQGALAGLPGLTCAQLQVQATREDDPSMCSVYQATIGSYCGCENPKAAETSSVCRICGANQTLPDHLKTIDAHAAQTCGELEFAANQQQQQQQHDCQLYQKLYQQDCCGDLAKPILHDHHSRAVMHRPLPTAVAFPIVAAAALLLLFVGGGPFFF